MRMHSTSPSHHLHLYDNHWTKMKNSNTKITAERRYCDVNTTNTKLAMKIAQIHSNTTKKITNKEEKEESEREKEKEKRRMRERLQKIEEKTLEDSWKTSSIQMVMQLLYSPQCSTSKRKPIFLMAFSFYLKVNEREREREKTREWRCYCRSLPLSLMMQR